MENNQARKTIIICKKSAALFWQRTDINLNKMKVKNLPQNYCYKIRKQDVIQVAKDLKLPLPLDVASVKRSNNCSGKTVRCHVRIRNYPDQSYMSFSYSNYNVLVDSPELLFLEMAKNMNFLDYIKFGYELCGKYFIDSDEKIISRKPLTSKSKIENYVKETRAVSGKVKALDALRYIADNSRSPKETSIAMHAMLPIRKGGYEMPAPLLNLVTFLIKDAVKIMGKEVLEVDIVWEKEKVAIEYNSNMFHAEPEDLTLDAKRQAAMQTSGYKSFVLTAGMINNFNTYDAFMKSIRKELGLKDMEKELDENYAKRKEIHSQIYFNSPTITLH